MTPQEVVKFAQDNECKMVDYKFLDFVGIWQHFSTPMNELSEDTFEEGMGFSGKGSIHPKQIPLLNNVYTPTEEQVAHARRIIRTFEEADTGLVVVDGKLIERPVLRDMYRILTVAERAR